MKNDRGSKKIITREKHPGKVAQDHKLAALMKKRKEEILHNKKQSTEQSTVQSTVQPSVQSSIQSTVQPTEQPSVQSTVQSNGAYGLCLWCWYTCCRCHWCLRIFFFFFFFAYNTFQPKNK